MGYLKKIIGILISALALSGCNFGTARISEKMKFDLKDQNNTDVSLKDVKPGDGSAEISWIAALDGTENVSEYLVSVYDSSDAVVKEEPSSTTIKTISGLEPGQLYKVSVSFKGKKKSGKSKNSLLFIPFTSTHFSGTAGNASVSLSWISVIGETYKVFMKSSSSGSFSEVPASKITFDTMNLGAAEISGLTNKTAYSFRLQVSNAEKVSKKVDLSTTLTPDSSILTTPKPTHFTAGPEGTSIKLNWALESGVTYTLSRSVSTGNFSTLQRDVTTDTYTDSSSLGEGTTYNYRLVATKNSVASEAVYASAAIVAPGSKVVSEPNNLRCGDCSPGTTLRVDGENTFARIEWDAPKTGSGNIKYKVYYSEDEKNVNTLMAGCNDISNRSCDFASNEKRSYSLYFRVVANNEAGVPKSSGNLTLNRVYIAPSGTLAPTGVLAHVDTAAKSILITWNQVPGATSYKIERALNSAFTSISGIISDVTALSYLHKDPVVGTPYFYRVYAMKGPLVSPTSTFVTGTVSTTASNLDAPGVEVVPSRTAFAIKVTRPSAETTGLIYTVFRAISNTTGETKNYAPVSATVPVNPYGGANGTSTTYFELSDVPLAADKGKFFSYYVSMKRVSDGKTADSVRLENKKIVVDAVQAPVTQLTASRLGMAIQVSWNSPGSLSTLMNYSVRRTKIDGTAEKKFDLMTGTTSFFDDKESGGLAEGHSYFYYVTAAENATATIKSVEVKSTQVDFLKTSCPGLSIQVINGGAHEPEKIVVNWSMTATPTSDYMFQVTRKVKDGAYGGSITGPSELPPYSDTGLDSSKVYQYKVSCKPKSAPPGDWTSSVESAEVQPSAKPTGYSEVWEQLQKVDFKNACAKNITECSDLCTGDAVKSTIAEKNSEYDFFFYGLLLGKNTGNVGDGIERSKILGCLKKALGDGDASINHAIAYLREKHKTGYMKPITVTTLDELRYFRSTYLCDLYRNYALADNPIDTTTLCANPNSDFSNTLPLVLKVTVSAMKGAKTAATSVDFPTQPYTDLANQVRNVMAPLLISADPTNPDDNLVQTQE